MANLSQNVISAIVQKKGLYDIESQQKYAAAVLAFGRQDTQYNLVSADASDDEVILAYIDTYNSAYGETATPVAPTAIETKQAPAMPTLSPEQQSAAKATFSKQQTSRQEYSQKAVIAGLIFDKVPAVKAIEEAGIEAKVGKMVIKTLTEDKINAYREKVAAYANDPSVPEEVGTANTAAFDEMVAAMHNATDVKVYINDKAMPSIKGVVVEEPTADSANMTTNRYTQKKFLNNVMLGKSAGHILPPASRANLPTAMLAEAHSKDKNGIETSKTIVKIGKKKEVYEANDNTALYAYVPKSGEVVTSDKLKTADSFKIFAYDKQGNIKTTAKGDKVVRTVRFSGTGDFVAYVPNTSVEDEFRPSATAATKDDIRSLAENKIEMFEKLIIANLATTGEVQDMANTMAKANNEAAGNF